MTEQNFSYTLETALEGGEVAEAISRLKRTMRLVLAAGAMAHVGKFGEQTAAEIEISAVTGVVFEMIRALAPPDGEDKLHQDITEIIRTVFPKWRAANAAAIEHSHANHLPAIAVPGGGTA